ncbi:hypothetical protein MTO96_033605 [Rhipicephalus appendiculatus]
MNVRLRANEPVGKLAERLRHVGGPLAVRDLDLTNCFDVDADELVPLIAACKLLQHLRCASSIVPPSDVLMLVMQRLPHLVELEFSCLANRTVAEAEGEPPTAFDFADYAAVSANFTYQRSTTFRELRSTTGPGGVRRRTPEYTISDVPGRCPRRPHA